ncbi:DUF2235 domain-containing protein [Paracoccus luteus]|uniref:DUF2235 domain-containing protein n=1 Tax=Paracoccus luteus TaxID=2508543 RepID=UPI001FE476DB|nr:DUF2235 domain-containing protein [Paracoccus luteus]
MTRPRRPIPHIILMDGTLATTGGPRATHIGTIRRLVRRAGPVRVHYARGPAWDDWRGIRAVATGRGVEDRIAAAYGWLASSWRPGDPIFVFGYSRGAFAARSLVGMIGRVGLLTPRAATERNIRLAWRFYHRGGSAGAMAAFRRRCHPDVAIDMVGVFDTVMALGVRLPLLWMLTEARHRFHDHNRLGGHVRFGAQALALDETRAAFQPILLDAEGADRIEQAWFRGSHADIGGQLDGDEAARPLANIPLVWMLERAEAHGLRLPPGWRGKLPCDARAPSVGSWRGWGRAFLLRAPRTVGTTGADTLHASALPYDGAALVGLARRPRRWRRLRLPRRAAAVPPDAGGSGRPPPAAL